MNFEPSLTLIESLKDPSVYSHPVSEIRILETHISWVILTGLFAYKIKKPVDLGFLDFSTLTLRYQACLEELRLNRRIAPNLYLEVIAISGTPVTPRLAGDVEPFEYALKMRQFPIEATLDQALPKGQIQSRHIDNLAQDLAQFHSNLTSSPETAEFGNPEVIEDVVKDIVNRFSLETQTSADRDVLQSLQQWIQREHGRCYQTFATRKNQGFIRECHGDLHLANVVLLNDRPTPFDGIEFSEHLRWIDLMSDIAFFIMDLMAHGRSDFAWRFLVAYLEYTGDYEGMAVFRFYEVYRALVRAKIAKVRLNQIPHQDDSIPVLEKEFHRYTSIAQTLAQPSPPSLIIMRGLSGSGKTTVSQTLLETMGAVRLRSDIERKRMFGIPPKDQSTKKIKEEMYSGNTGDTLHCQLREIEKKILSSDYHVIVDATFLKRRHRDLFCRLADEQNVPFLILDVQSSLTTLKDRVAYRAEQRSDASEADLAVLEQQQREEEPLGNDEQKVAVTINSEEPLDTKIVFRRLLKSR